MSSIKIALNDTNLNLKEKINKIIVAFNDYFEIEATLLKGISTKELQKEIERDLKSLENNSQKLIPQVQDCILQILPTFSFPYLHRTEEIVGDKGKTENKSIECLQQDYLTT